MVEVERCDQVDEQGSSEEVGNLVGWQAGGALDEGDQFAEALARDLAAIWIVAGASGLEPADALASFVTELGVGRGDCVERLLATLAGGCALKDLESLDQAAPDRRLEKVLLRSEQPEDGWEIPTRRAISPLTCARTHA